MTKSEGNVKIAILFTAAQIRCKFDFYKGVNVTKSDANIKFAIIFAVAQSRGKTTHLLCIYTLSKHAVNAAITIFAS